MQKWPRSFGRERRSRGCNRQAVPAISADAAGPVTHFASVRMKHAAQAIGRRGASEYRPMSFSFITTDPLAAPQGRPAEIARAKESPLREGRPCRAAARPHNAREAKRYKRWLRIERIGDRQAHGTSQRRRDERCFGLTDRAGCIYAVTRVVADSQNRHKRTLARRH